ncbi:MAG: cytochrome c oxidase assembly protein [Solirubrobacterales bacterium]|nr:cytochrome c oxidase assembly protein [Solirubrobacterales bacterium]
MLAHAGGLALDPLQIAPAAGFAALYAVRARTLAGQGRPVPAWRQACWYGGLAVIVASLVSPLGHLAQERFVAHMAEHLLIADIGALALALGLTGPLLAPLLRNPALSWLRVLAHPAAALGLWAANLVFWHLAGPHEAAVRADAAHALQHLCFIGAGANVWLALLGPLPKPAWFGNLAKLGYIVAVRLLGTVVANVFLWAPDAFYDVYDAPDPLADQIAAGTVMMVEESILTICLLGWLFVRSAREDSERQELLELAAGRGVALDERRAARAVAAGRGEELRRRIKGGPHG